MKGFALDENGDLLIENNEIVMAHGDELLRQKIERLLSTNKGEWSLNVEEGITFSNILGKSSIDDESRKLIVMDEVRSGLAQVDDTLVLDEFDCEFDTVERKLIVKFTAIKESGETVVIDLSY